MTDGSPLTRSVVIGRRLRASTPTREEIAQHRDFFVGAVEVACDVGIEIGGARKYFLFSGSGPANPAISRISAPSDTLSRTCRGRPREAGEQSGSGWPESSLYNASENARPLCREDHGETDGDQSFGDSRIGHFQGGGGANGPVENNDLQAERRECSTRFRCARHIIRWPIVTSAWRPADDPAIDEARPRRLNDLRHLFRRLGIDGVEVDIDGLRAARARAAERRSANESASAGGTIESRKSASVNSSSLTGSMPAFVARSALAALRPEDWCEPRGRFRQVATPSRCLWRLGT